jgi:hypothetical protein
MRYRKKPSAKGTPPSAHKDNPRGPLLRELLWFAYEPERMSVVIGPVGFGARPGANTVPTSRSSAARSRGSCGRKPKHGRRASPAQAAAFKRKLASGQIQDQAGPKVRRRHAPQAAVHGAGAEEEHRAAPSACLEEFVHQGRVAVRRFTDSTGRCLAAQARRRCDGADPHARRASTCSTPPAATSPPCCYHPAAFTAILFAAVEPDAYARDVAEDASPMPWTRRRASRPCPAFSRSSPTSSRRPRQAREERAAQVVRRLAVPAPPGRCRGRFARAAHAPRAGRYGRRARTQRVAADGSSAGAAAQRPLRGEAFARGLLPVQGRELGPAAEDFHADAQARVRTRRRCCLRCPPNEEVHRHHRPHVGDRRPDQRPPSACGS